MIRSRDVDRGRFAFSTKQSIILLVLYFIGYVVLLAPVGLVLSTLIFKTSNAIHPSIMMFMILMLLISSVYVVRGPLFDSLRFFKNDLANNLKILARNFAFLWIFNILSNIVILFVLGERSPENQLSVEQGIASVPLLYGILVMVFAPIVEELVFRGVLYQQFRSKKSFLKAVLISTLLFASIHVIPAFLQSFDFTELVFIIQYAGLSFFMIRSFEETSSIWGSIFIHFINNAIGFLLIFLA